MPTRQSPHPIASNGARLRVLFAGICALILTVGIARFAYTPMLPVMHREAGLTNLAAGWLATFNYAGYITGALIAAAVGNLRQKFVMYRIGLVLAVLITRSFQLGPAGEIAQNTCLYLAIALALISGADYFYRSRRLFI